MKKVLVLVLMLFMCFGANINAWNFKQVRKCKVSLFGKVTCTKLKKPIYWNAIHPKELVDSSKTKLIYLRRY